MKVSAIIVVKGSPPHLFETLHSIEDFVSEIIIGDIGIDKTVKQKLERNSKHIIISFDPTTPFIELIRNEMVTKASGDFIVYLDPDEIFPHAVKAVLLQEYESFDCFYFPRKNVIFNKWIQHARWWPDYQLRFFKKGTVNWPKKIHTQPHTTGKLYHFPEKEEYAITHYNYENIDEFMQKMPRYAKAEALGMLEAGELLTFKDAMTAGISEFMSRFFSLEGYKDGTHGFVLSFLQMMYAFLVYFYFWELKKYPEIPVDSLVEGADLYFKQGLYETKFWKNEKKLGKSIEKIKMKIVKRL